jgi:hypothetical protein
MWHACESLGVLEEFLSEDPKGRSLLGYLDVCAMIQLKWIRRKYAVRIWNGLKWFRTSTRGM